MEVAVVDEQHNKKSKTSIPNSKHDSSSDRHNGILLPGLPNHLALRCLTPVHPCLLYRVCRSWRRHIYTPSFPPFSCLYALLSPSQSQPQNHTTADTKTTTSTSPSTSTSSSNSTTTTTTTNNNNNHIEFFCFEPISSSWRQLPVPSIDPPIRLLHRHPSFLSRNLSIQSLTVSDHLVLIAATDEHFRPAISSPLVFRPTTKQWFYGPQLSVPRRWCVTGSVRGGVYVASGVGSHYRGDVARLMEEWDLSKDREEWKWENKAGFRDGRFSREAIEGVGYRGKLCMVNVKGNAVKEGALYDVEMDRWEDMPPGMVAGWNGPVAAMDEETMYVIDEAGGSLRRYDGARDRWELVIASDQLKGADQIVAGKGRVCAVCRHGEQITVVDVVARPARLWVARPPPAFQAVAIHILPRMAPEID